MNSIAITQLKNFLEEHNLREDWSINDFKKAEKMARQLGIELGVDGVNRIVWIKSKEKNPKEKDIERENPLSYQIGKNTWYLSKQGNGFKLENKKTGEVDYPVIYHDKTIGYERPEKLPKSLKKWIQVILSHGIDKPLKNPGERWHKQMESQYAELYTEADRKGLRHHKDYFEGKADAHRDSAIVSRRMGMENPVKEYIFDWIDFKGKKCQTIIHASTEDKASAIFHKKYGKQVAIVAKKRVIHNPKLTREENPVQIPERVLAWREKLRPGAIMKPETFKYIKGVAARAKYREPSAVGGKAYWVTLLSKYLKTHPGDTEVKRLHRQLISRKYAGKNPFDIGTAGAIAAGVAVGEVGKYALNKSGILRNPKSRELSVPEKHQLKIAYDTLKMTDTMAKVMGGMTKEEAREVIKRLTGKIIKNPRSKKRPLGLFFAFNKIANENWPLAKVVSELKRKYGYTVSQAREVALMAEAMYKEKYTQTNPIKNAVKIYDNILAIEAKKGKDSHFPNENFRHDFSKIKGKASVYGMPDGSLVIKGKKRLWKEFDYD